MEKVQQLKREALIFASKTKQKYDVRFIPWWLSLDFKRKPCPKGYTYVAELEFDKPISQEEVKARLLIAFGDL